MYFISALAVAIVIVITGYALKKVRKSDLEDGLYLNEENYTITGTLKNLFKSQDKRIMLEQALENEKKRREVCERNNEERFRLIALFISAVVCFAVCAFTAPGLIPIPIITLIMTAFYCKIKSVLYIFISVGTSLACAIISFHMNNYLLAVVAAACMIIHIMFFARALRKTTVLNGKS